MILKCTKCGGLYTANSASQEAICSCSEEKTILAEFNGQETFDPAMEETTVRLDSRMDTQPDSAPTIRAQRTNSVLFSLGLHADNGQLHPMTAPEKYEYLQALGAGGMGEVVRAWDRDLHRFVAVKRLRSTADSREAILRFVKEAQITGKLEHPNIVPIHDLGIDSQGRIYFSLKLIEGESLKSIIEKRKTNQELAPGVRYKDVYTPLRMIEISISVCQAIAYAHAKGVIHRDLKPDNIMLGRYGEVLVVDWGIAKVFDAGTPPEEQQTIPVTALNALSPEASMEGSVAGTPAYMPPEQAQGRVLSIDSRSDVYALGAVIYHVIAGRPPYEGNSTLDVLKKVQTSPPKPLTTGTVGFHPVPRELKAICSKAMSREPEHRYATAEELRDDLQAYLEHRPVQACPMTPWQRFQKWFKRNRKQAQIGSIAALTAVLVLSSAYYGYREWRIRGLQHDAQQKLAAFRQALPAAASARDSDPTPAYDRLNLVLLDLQRALDLAPNRTSTKRLLSDTYLEQWRLAMSKENFALAENARREVNRYEGREPNRYSTELNGSAVADLVLDPPSSQLYLFKFVSVDSRLPDGSSGSRLVPIPYELKKFDVVRSALDSEQHRAQSAPPVLAGEHTIFNLSPLDVALVPHEEIHNLHLPPGSYLVVARSPNRADTRVPLFIPRTGRVEQTIHLPAPDELPAGFFYVAGGTARIGGDSANALTERSENIGPFLLFHDEISMGDYSEFLKALVADHKRAEAEKRVPRDFGKKIVIMARDGSLSGINTKHPKWFLASAVRGISFNDVQAYIQWRSTHDGLLYRLPTEYEWESACRGADGRRYSWGNRYAKGFAFILQGYNDTAGDRSWKWEDYKDESPWGVHDLAGGVAEWTSSIYKPSATAGDAEYGQYAIRGNAWSLPPVGLECAFRTSGQPEYFHPTIGFRLALDYPVKSNH
ncbi:MAG TPA: bifunctional serine/threonine-protein kinase/formylglycine-generating enzyme family protein [Candidatus Angelobacter sp.]|nr:bifunctional serine/threonine-protein kinase/formylglycine-generating enzyme family protein [Candidatus Angelobacter sp.]